MKKQGSMATIGKLFSYTRKWVWMLFSSALFLIFAETAVLVSYTYLGKTLDYVMGNGTMAPQSALLITIGVAVFSGIFGILSRYLLERGRNSASYHMTNLTVHHVSKLPMSYYDNVNSGDLVSRLENDMFGVRQIFAYPGSGVLSGTVMVAVVFCYLLLQNVFIGLINIILIISLLLLSNKVGNICKNTYREMLKSLGKANSEASDSFQGIREVKAFNAIDRKTASFDCLMNEAQKYNIKLCKWGEFSNVLSELSGILPQLATFGIGGYMAIQGTISVGTVLAMQLSINTLRSSMRWLTYAWTAFLRSIPGAERILEVLKEDTEEKLWSENRKGTDKKCKENAAVCFENVSFSYPTRKEESVLNGLSFHIKHGEKVAVVGESGCGKSTLAKLLTGFYKADSGEIYYNGTEIGNMSLSGLRSGISMVTQDAFLFPVTIHKNISYGRGYGVKESDGENTDVEVAEDILQVSKNAQLHDFVMSLPKKYESLVGERGVKLSGGQQQRVSIARAMIKNAEFLILDEPTSALDSVTEHQIQESLEKLTEGKTSIIIAHRLSSIKNADRVLVMKEGKVVESGTHQELLERKGEYFNLYNRQAYEEHKEERGAV